ncbi:hypothetical protein V8D89_003415 [Ganoderma adspersum]
MPVCRDKPDALLSLEEVGIIPTAQPSSSRDPRGSRSSPLAPPYRFSGGHGGLGFQKSPASPFAVTVASGTTLPSRSPSKAGGLSTFKKVNKSAPTTFVPGSVFKKNDRLKTPESTTTGAQDSTGTVSGNSGTAPELALVESNVVEDQDRIGLPERAGLEIINTRPKRARIRRKRKTDS